MRDKRLLPERLGLPVAPDGTVALTSTSPSTATWDWLEAPKRSDVAKEMARSPFGPADPEMSDADAAMTGQVASGGAPNDPVAERLQMLPLARTQSGRVVPALPGLVQSAIDGFGALQDAGARERAGTPSSDKDNARHALDVAGLATVGGIAAPKPSGALGMSGGRLRGLDVAGEPVRNAHPVYGRGVKGSIADPASEAQRLGLTAGLPGAPADGFFNPASGALLQSGVHPKNTVAYYQKQMGSRGGKLPPGQWDDIVKGKSPSDVIDRDWLVKEIDKRSPPIDRRRFYDPDDVSVGHNLRYGAEFSGDHAYKDYATIGPFTNYMETAVGYDPRRLTKGNDVGAFIDSHFEHPNLEGWYRSQDLAEPRAGFKHVKDFNRLIEEVQPQRQEKLRDLGAGAPRSQLDAWSKERDLATKNVQSILNSAVDEFGIKTSDDAPTSYHRLNEAELSLKRIANGVTGTPEQQARASDILGQLRVHQDRYNHLSSQISSGKKGVQPSPFSHDVNDATDVLAKNIIMDASSGRTNRLAWAPGPEQAKRYDKLLENVHGLRYNPDHGGHLWTRGNNNQWRHVARGVDQDKLHEHVGRERADSLLRQPVIEEDGARYHQATFPRGMSIGGEGMTAFYGDGITPGIFGTRLQSILRSVGQGDVSLSQLGIPQEVGRRRAGHKTYESDSLKYPSVALEDSTRDFVRRNGLSLYANGSKEAASAPLLGSIAADSKHGKLGYDDAIFYRGEASGHEPTSYPKGAHFSRDEEYAKGFANRGGIEAPRAFRLNLRNTFSDADLVTAEKYDRLVRSAMGSDPEIAKEMVDAVATGKSPEWFAEFAKRNPGTIVSEPGHVRQALSLASDQYGIFRRAGFDALDSGRDVHKLSGDGIRLLEAAFDPKKRRSHNLLAANKYPFVTHPNED